jgi:hypothetical protein
MSLLSSVNEVADLVSLDRFTQVAGTTNPDARTMLTLAQEAGEEIAHRVDWQRLIKVASIAASPYTLPEDYHRPVPGAMVVSALGVFARPITNTGEWETLRRVGSSQPYYYRTADKVDVIPLSAAENATLNYVSGHFVVEVNGTDLRPVFQKDDDSTVFNEDILVKGIVWRWKRQKGLDYVDDLAEFEAILASEIKADRGIT